MNSRQHSQVAEIGRTPMTSRELLPFLTSEDLAQSEETSAVCLPSHLKMFKQSWTHSGAFHGRREHLCVEVG